MFVEECLGVFRKYHFAYIPTNACGQCHKVVQPSVVGRMNMQRVIRHTEKINVMSFECSTFIIIEVAARGEEVI